MPNVRLPRCEMAAMGPSPAVALRLNGDANAPTVILTQHEAAALARELLAYAVAPLERPPKTTDIDVVATAIPVAQSRVRVDAQGRIVVDLLIPTAPWVALAFRMVPNVSGHLAREVSRILQADTPPESDP